MKITVGETEYEATFNGFTPIAFSRCFHVVGDNGVKRPKDISEDVGLITESLASVGIPAITGLLEIFYACIKTATPKFDVPFNEWVASFPPDSFDMTRGDGWAADVMGIVQENFFPSTTDDVDTAPAEKPAAAAAGKSK